MHKVFYLGTCSTCKRILNSLDLPAYFELKDIKKDPILEQELDHMKDLAGDYYSLFSKRSRNYRTLSLHLKELTEKDYRKYILQDYTFLKRPVFISNQRIFIGNSTKTVQEIQAYLKQL